MWIRKFRGNNTPNVIDRGTKINGDIESNSNWRIAGVLNGDLITTGKVSIESTAIIFGNIKGKQIQVDGKVTGNIIAKKKLILLSSCSISGEIEYKTLEMEEGASFSGRSHSAVTLRELEKMNAKQQKETSVIPDEKSEDNGSFLSKLNIKDLDKTPTLDSNISTKHKKIIIQ